MSWTISPGHFGVGTGAVGIIDEVREAIKVSKRVTEILKKDYGVKVNYIQDTVSKNKKDNLKWLVNQHNQTQRDQDMSIHFNSTVGESSKGIGTEILILNPNNTNKAANIVNGISSVSGLKNRGIKMRGDLAFLNGTKKPAYLIEVCFVNDKIDCAIYSRDFEKICQSIAKSMASISGVTKKTNETSKENVSENAENAKKQIKWAVKAGIFNEKFHEDVDSYSTEQLLRYQNILIDRLK